MSMHVTESDLLKVDLPNFVHSIVLEGNHSSLKTKRCFRIGHAFSVVFTTYARGEY